MDEKNKNTPIIDRIEELINESRPIPHHEIMQLMMRAESSSEIDIKKELEKISKKRNKIPFNIL